MTTLFRFILILGIIALYVIVAVGHGADLAAFIFLLFIANNVEQKFNKVL